MRKNIVKNAPRRSFLSGAIFMGRNMFLYYVSHGDPIYDPDSLTEFAHKQAKALVKRVFLRFG